MKPATRWSFGGLTPNGPLRKPFSGSGTTLIAAERTGRRCLALELDPRYVDVAVQRWQNLTGQAAVLDGDGRSFDDIAAACEASAA